MTQKSLQKQWANTQIDLSRLITSEITGSKDFPNKRQANDYVRRLFVKYNDLMRKFDEIYERLIHPQKRSILLILLDGLVGRLVELKHEMIKFDSCEYTYFEDLALDQNKTLDDLCLKIPHFISQNRSKSIEQRNQLIQQILDRLNRSKTDLTMSSSFDTFETKTKPDSNNDLTLAMAVRVLQAHERARQGRVHAYFMRRMKTQLKIPERKTINDDNLHQSCLVIQTLWRQKYTEKLFHIKQIEHAELLGMSLPRNHRLMKDNDEEREKKKRELQLKHQEEFERASIVIKEKIRQYEEIEVKSRLEHVLLQWLLESRQLYGQFPIYPLEEANGSVALFKDMTIADVQEFVNKQAQTLRNKKTKPKQTKKPIKKSKKKSSKQKPILNELEPSKFIPMINTQMGIYKDLFHERDETYNPTQEYDKLLAIDLFRSEVEDELRHDVDEILRNELIYLKLAIDNVEDKKKSKKKKKKKKGKKKVKDIVANRTNDSIFEELVETRILLPTKSVRQEDFLGDYQYSAETLRYNEKEPMPSLLDCQQLVILQIIFPLCSENIHRNLSEHKTVLLAGPYGSGKKLLVHIACNELGGVLLDLSPSSLARSFNTVDGLRVLFAMIKRLVASMPPILCMIGDTELLFAKKLNAQEKQYQPRRFQRLIRRFIKKFKPGERIMFIGLSNQPYRARVKSLLQIYKYIILCPRPNYGSRRKIFYHFLIEKFNMNMPEVELSILASISKGYTAGQILETIHQMKQMKSSNNSCTSNDFLPILAMKPAVFLDEENKIKSWYAKTPNGLKRLHDLAQISLVSPSKKRFN